MSNIATRLHSRTRLPTWDSPMMRWTNAGSTSTIVRPTSKVFLCVCALHKTKTKTKTLSLTVGISAISKAEAQQLADPTIAIPGTTDKYLVQLEVFHNLHCLNDLRKLLYPERYHMLEKATLKNGTIDRNSFGFRHWDHCIDSLRQALMCNADIAPTSFHVNIPFSRGFL